MMSTTRAASERAFVAVSALVFGVSAAITIVLGTAMSDGMPMPGGWTMSMAWMQMPGQAWTATAASFVAMWVVMMVAMMMPSLVPMLWRYREALPRQDDARLGGLTACVGIAYFVVWAACGIAIFPLGFALASIEMRQPAVARWIPIAIGAVVLLAGLLQFTARKVRHLAFCREAPELALSADAGTAWRHGVRLGIECCQCCAGLMTILLAAGVMNLAAMAVVATVIVIERVAPSGERIARAVGAAIVATGIFLIARAAGPG